MKDKSLNIMLIDNDKHVRDSLSLFFEGNRTDFLIFKSGLDGLNSLKYQKIDLVIADYFLPDMDGIEFLRRVSKTHPNATKILMSTILNDEIEKAIAKVGIDQFIEKPITITFLETIIGKLERIKRTDSKGKSSD
jgi:DNA-binding response OmpR family regulator